MKSTLAQHDAQQAVKRATIARNRAAVDLAEALVYHEADSEEVDNALGIYYTARRRYEAAYAAQRKGTA